MGISDEFGNNTRILVALNCAQPTAYLVKLLDRGDIEPTSQRVLSECNISDDNDKSFDWKQLADIGRGRFCVMRGTSTIDFLILVFRIDFVQEYNIQTSQGGGNSSQIIFSKTFNPYDYIPEKFMLTGFCIASAPPASPDNEDKDKDEGKIKRKREAEYYELRVGGGAMPQLGDLVVVDMKGCVEGSGEVFIDTFVGDKKPLALVMGSRPYSNGICEGIEYVLRNMKAGGKRRVIIPPNLGFGEEGADLGAGLEIPPSATLEYVIQVDKVSIALLHFLGNIYTTNNFNFVFVTRPFYEMNCILLELSIVMPWTWVHLV